MSDKYIKRTKKEKGRKKKVVIRQLGDFVNQIKPVVYIAVSMMIMDDLKKKESEKDVE